MEGFGQDTLHSFAIYIRGMKWTHQNQHLTYQAHQSGLRTRSLFRLTMAKSMVWNVESKSDAQRQSAFTH
jgi:hypothetical protein